MKQDLAKLLTLANLVRDAELAKLAKLNRQLSDLLADRARMIEARKCRAQATDFDPLIASRVERAFEIWTDAKLRENATHMAKVRSAIERAKPPAAHALGRVGVIEKLIETLPEKRK